MADMGEIGIRVNDNGAVVTLKSIGKATDELTEAEKRQNAILRQLAQANLEVQNARKMERTALAGLTAAQREQARVVIEAQGGMQRYIEVQRAMTRETQLASRATTQNAAAVAAVSTTAQTGHLSVGRLGNSFASLTTHLVGLHPILGNLTGVLSTFAVGATTTVGILIGAAGLAYAYQKITEGARAAKKEVDDLTKSLLDQAKAAHGATVEGRQESVDVLQRAYDAALRAQAAARARNISIQAGLNPAAAALATLSGGGLGAEEKAAKAVRLAYIALQEAKSAAAKAGFEGARQSHELEQTLAADRQRWADEENKHGDGASQRRNAEIALMEKRNRLAAQFAAEEEARTLRLAKAWADLIRAQHEAATERLGLPSDDALRADIKRNVEDALGQAAASKKYAADMQAIWKQGLAKILTDGTKSYRDFFEDVLQMFTRMMARMEQEGKTKGFGYKMLGFGSALIGGGVAGYQVGQQAGGATLGALGGAAAGAATGYQFAGPMGAVIGGLAGFGAGLIGGISASREHAAALKAAMESFKQSMADFHFAATGTTGSLADLTRQVHATAAALRASAAANYHPGAWGTSPAQNAAYAAQMAQIAADEAAYVARLAEEDRLKKQYFKEDLQVRYLRATGRDAEADKLAKKQADEREYAAAVAAGADAATLAFLRTIHVAEELKKASDALSTSLRNAPSGFKIESYINRFAAARPWEPPLGMPYSPQGGPMGTGGAFPSFGKTGYTPPGQGEAQLRAGMARLSAPKATTTINIGTVTLALPPGMPPEKVGPAFMTYIRKVQLQTVGPNAPLADAMEYAS